MMVNVSAVARWEVVEVVEVVVVPCDRRNTFEAAIASRCVVVPHSWSCEAIVIAATQTHGGGGGDDDGGGGGGGRWHRWDEVTGECAHLAK